MSPPPPAAGAERGVASRTAVPNFKRLRRVVTLLLCLVVTVLLLSYIAHVYLGLGIYPRYSMPQNISVDVRVPVRVGGARGGAPHGYISPRHQGPMTWETFIPLPLTGECFKTRYRPVSAIAIHSCFRAACG